MGFIYQTTNHYGIEAIVALERHFSPSEEKYCTALSEAARICDTYGIPERELLPRVRQIAAAEEFMLEHLSESEEMMQFLFAPLCGGNTSLAWSLAWDPADKDDGVYKYVGHSEAERLRDVAAIAAQFRENPAEVPQSIDTVCALIDYLDSIRIPAEDKWKFLALFAHLETYEQNARRIVSSAAELLKKAMQNEETQAQLRECIEKTKENAPRLSNAFPPTRQDITFLPCVMPFNSMRFISNETSITVVVGVLYWTILRLTEKYAANDERLLGCFKTLSDKSRLDILKLLKEREYSGQELAKELGISQGTVSHHLNILVRDDLICITKDGSRLRCSLNREALENMMDDIRRLLL